MTREEVISAFPVTEDLEFGIYGYLMILAVILIIGTVIFRIERKNRISLSACIGSSIFALIIIVSFAYHLTPQFSSMNGDQW